jgi:signal transduction histidine kinase
VSSAELLRLRPGTGGVADSEALAETIIRSALDAATVARRLIDYTRSVTAFDPPRGTAQPEELALDRLVAEVVREEQERGDHPGVDWVVKLAPIPLIKGHSGQLRGMLRHLLQNAYEAMPQQRGTISFSTSTDDRGWAVLELRDSGQGMGPDVLERAVEPFFTTKPGHMGVGLSIANGVWRRHRGTLSVRGAPGEGSMVRLCVEPVRG